MVFEQYLIHGSITTILLTGLWIALKVSLSSYFNEKAKNLAQKEDIADITREVELVRSEFTKELSQLNSQLQKQHTIEIQHREQERNALIKFHADLEKALLSGFSINTGLYTPKTSNMLYEKLLTLEVSRDNMFLSFAQVQLMVQNEELVKTAKENMLAVSDYLVDLESKGKQIGLMLFAINDNEGESEANRALRFTQLSDIKTKLDSYRLNNIIDIRKAVDWFTGLTKKYLIS